MKKHVAFRRASVVVFLLASGFVHRAAHAQEAGNEWTEGRESAAPEPSASAAPSNAPNAEPAPVEEPKLKPLAQVPEGEDPTADQAGSGSEAPAKSAIEKRILHGFRMGYLYVANYDQPTSDNSDPECKDCSLKDRYNMRTPHQYLLGYEIMGRLIGHGWLNVIVVGNVLVSGLEQSKFWPSANLLIGFELDQSFQVGLGPNFTLEEDKPAHLVMAAGWTPVVGNFYVPVHGFFIPDVDGNHRMGATVGVNW